MPYDNQAVLPRYDQLPVIPGTEIRVSWGVFGAADEIGTVNLAAPEAVRRGACLVRRGIVFPLDWLLDQPDPPILGRGALRRTVKLLDDGPNPGTDDVLDNFHTQGSTQWDALCHVGHPEYGYYNGYSFADVAPNGTHNGIDQWAKRGIAGRFVLVDVAGHRDRLGAPIQAGTATAIEVDELEAILEAQGVGVERGDILLVRTGWIRHYEALDRRAKSDLGNRGVFPAVGLSSGERTAAWLWDHGIAAVAADCPALEVMPFDKTNVEGFLHYRLIVFLGMAVGELFYLERLAAHCLESGVYEGLLTAAPLHLVGGSGSPGNAMALM